MLNQEYYINWDDELVAERERAKDALFEFNATRPSRRDERDKLLRQLLGSVGDNPWVESPFNCGFGYNISVGDNFHANTNCTILDCAPVSFGDNVLIGPKVSFYTPNYAFDAQKRAAGYERSLPIRIGYNAWISGSVTVVPGVSIGSNRIIGADTAITRDIPSNVVAAGVPCKVIRRITDQDKLGLKLDL